MVTNFPTSADTYGELNKIGQYKAPKDIIAAVVAVENAILGGTVAPLLRAFPVAYNSAGILTGYNTGYSPTVGDEIMAVFLQVETAWNGRTPKMDCGTYLSGAVKGILGASAGATMNPAGADDLVNAGPGLAIPTSYPPLFGAWLPLFAKVVTSAPFKIVVSQDGTSATAPGSVEANNTATVPTTVVAATNDTFLLGGVTYTVAPGVYATIAALQAAMAAAVRTGGTLASDVTLSNAGGKLTATATADGYANTMAFGTGPTDFLAASGFDDAQALAGGTGGSPRSTQGAATLYVLTATPRSS